MPTAGIAQHGAPAHRPSWGRLNELKLLLPHATFRGFSATMPPHMLAVVEKSFLRPKYVMIRTALNRPNIIYATHCVVKSLKTLENYECFLTRPYDPLRQPNVLIFCDDSDFTVSLVRHFESCVTPEFRGKGLFLHYHSFMSPGYLAKAHSSFTDPSGACKILVSTSAEAVVSIALWILYVY